LVSNRVSNRLSLPALLLVLPALAAVLCSCAGPPGIRRHNEVATIAGSGRLGMQDGPASSASFVSPSSLARASDGTLYISDEGAQRIRALRDGRVTTIAGTGNLGLLGLSVPGGYLDGPAAIARFNHPMGIAIGPDGALYIADSRNGAIRKLSGGVVSTLIKGLVSPRALAFDAKGNLWIADHSAGLRRLGTDGRLTTIALYFDGKRYDKPPLDCIGITPDPVYQTLFTSAEAHVFIYDLATGKQTHYYTTGGEGRGSGSQFVGQIAALDTNAFLATDTAAGNIRYLRFRVDPFVTQALNKRIAGGDADHYVDNAGFADGSRDAARFYAPRGLVVDGNRLIVADAGNRRIRSIALPDLGQSEYGLLHDYAYDDKHYEIVYAGPSTTFYDSIEEDSICHELKKKLNESGVLPKPARCHSIRLDSARLPMTADYIQNYLESKPIDLVIFAELPGVDDANFRPALEAILKSRPKTRFAIFWESDELNISSDEDEFSHEWIATLHWFADDLDDELARVRRAASALTAGFPIWQYDSLQDFLAYERRPHLPLFLTADPHPNPRGNAWIGDHLANFVERSLRASH
jgi:DNA-binding beta-propeller fold protein YncE